MNTAKGRLTFWWGVKRLGWRWDWHTRVEKAQLWIVWRLPRWVIYWSFIRAATHSPNGEVYPLNPAERLTGDVLHEWLYD